METELIPLVMDFFKVSKPLAYLIVINILAIPVMIFVAVRLGFHAQYFDVLKSYMEESKEDVRAMTKANVEMVRAFNAYITKDD